jgi:CheY-like chemotaxis protein
MASYPIETLDQLGNHIQICSQSQLTIRLDLEASAPQGIRWSLFVRQGCLVWGASDAHPVRRWSRQLFQHCPPLAIASTPEPSNLPQCWDYGALVNLVGRERMPREHIATIIEGLVAEVLFDLIHWCQQQNQSLQMQLTYRRIPQDILASTLPFMRLDVAWRQAKQAWQDWQRAGFEHWSPNLAPVIWQTDTLRQHASSFAYNTLTKLINGDRTLRDLAAQLKQHPLPLTRSISPYLYQGAIGLVEVEDLGCPVKFAPGSSAQSVGGTAAIAPTAALPQTQSVSPLVAYIDDNRFDSLTMNQILSQTGYRFIAIRDPVQALPILLEKKPDLIFLDLLMPITNGYEVCIQIRRVSALKETPVIIVTASDGQLDRARAKLVGASGFISKPIVPTDVLTVLQQYLTVPLSTQFNQLKAVQAPFASYRSYPF